MAAALLIVLTLLSVASSLLVFLGTVCTLLSRSQSLHHRYSFILRFGDLPLQQRLQVDMCLLDSILLLPVTALFLYYATTAADGQSIGEVALGSVGASFAATVVLLSRPVMVAVWTKSNYLLLSYRKHYRALLGVVGAMVVLSLSAATAASCSVVRPNQSVPCVALASTKYIIITANVALACLAVVTLFAFTRALHNTKHRFPAPVESAPIAALAHPTSIPSPLICTPPLPWPRQIRTRGQGVVDKTTDFGAASQAGLARNCAEFEIAKSDYGPNMVRGLLGATGGSDRMTDGATTSLGNSAVASSTNPYHTGSTLSLASRDALAEASTSRTDLVAARGGSQPITKGTAYSQELHRLPVGSPRTCSPSGSLHNPRRPRFGLPRSSTQPLLDRPRSPVEAREVTPPDIGDSRVLLIRLISTIVSLLGPVALSSTALLINTSKRQAAVLLTSFCLPAAVLLLQEVLLGCFCIVRYTQSPRANKREARGREPRSEETAPGSSCGSASSSFIVVYTNAETLRNRLPHLRSHSCPLEFEANGYSNELQETDAQIRGTHAKQRRSLSSVKSVPYLDKHWTAGKVAGDRVVAPRSSFVRGLNLMINPRPKLEILPGQKPVQIPEETQKEECRQRRPWFPTSVTSAIVEGLLDTPQRHAQPTASREPSFVQHASWQILAPALSSSDTTLHGVQREEEAQATTSGHFDQSRDEMGGGSTDVILNMDDTPGSPRLQTDTCAVSDHSGLQSPTKRMRLGTPSAWQPDQAPDTQATTSSCSRNDQSQVSGNSASRLFSEIMDLVRGNGQARMSDLPSSIAFGQSLRRTPPRGYTSLDGGTAPDEAIDCNASGSQAGTVIIHQDESSGEFRTASSCIAAPNLLPVLVGGKNSADGAGGDHGEDSKNASASTHTQEGVELSRKGSSSSTFSISSLSTRLRSLGRTAAAGSTPAGSPNARTETGQVKKVRSRTFASAFGIELGVLNRSGSRGRKGIHGTYVESSPSSSAGTCQSSLLDLSNSASPVSAKQKAGTSGHHQSGTPSPGDSLNGKGRELAMRTQRRHMPHADSVIDLLEEDSGGTDVESLNRTQLSLAAVQVKTASRVKAINGVSASTFQLHGSQSNEQDLEGISEGFGGLCEVDLGDVTVNDVWERCFPPLSDTGSESKASKSDVEDPIIGEGNTSSLMAFEMTRLAKAPFLYTVDEELEGEMEAEAYEHHSVLSVGQALHASDAIQRSRGYNHGHEPDEDPCAAVDTPRPERPSLTDSFSTAGKECIASRAPLLLEQEANQRRIEEQLAEHEALFPHKTLSQIDEVTEVATLLRTSGFRANSGSSGSKLASDKLSMTTDFGVDHLGLPRSLRCRQQSVGKGTDDRDGVSTASESTIEAAYQVEVNNGSNCPRDAEAIPLPFVTPRSRVRCRAAAGRASSKDRDLVDKNNKTERYDAVEQPLVAPSPRSVSERLGQLGLNQGIWLRSPIKLDLEPSVTKGEDGNFQLVHASIEGEGKRRTTRLRKSLTLAKGKFGSDSKGAAAMRKLVRLDHQDSPKREFRERMAKRQNGQLPPPSSSSGLSTSIRQGKLRSWDAGGGGGDTLPQEKRLLHKPFRKRRKSRSKGVAIMIARHQFTVVDEDDSLIQRLGSANNGPSNVPD